MEEREKDIPLRQVVTGIFSNKGLFERSTDKTGGPYSYLECFMMNEAAGKPDPQAVSSSLATDEGRKLLLPSMMSVSR